MPARIGRLGFHQFRQRLQLAVGAVHHAEGVFHRDRLRAIGLDVDVGTAQAWQDQRVFTVHQVAAVELGADLHGQVAITQRFEGSRTVWRGLGEVAAQADKYFGAAFEHGVNRFHDVVAVFPRYLELEATFQAIEERHRWAFVDAHGAVALHVTVATYWAQAGTRAANVAA